MYDNLKALMAIKGITIEAIARLLNVHRNTVSGKLDGESEFTFGQAERIQETMFPEYNSKSLRHDPDPGGDREAVRPVHRGRAP